MKKEKYLFLGLFPLAISATFLMPRATGNSALPPAHTSEAHSEVGNDSWEKQDDNTPVDQLVLVGATIPETISILEKLTGKTALCEQRLPQNKISIEAQTVISRQEAIDAIISVLSLNGVAVVDMGEKFMKIVSSRSALSQAPNIIDASLLDQESSQKICSKFFRLKFIDVNEFQKLIRPVLTPSNSNMLIFAQSNSMLITDTMTNLKHIEDLINRTDCPVQMAESITFIPLNNIKASAIAKKIEQLKRGALRKYLSNTTVDSDDSSNQLIVITNKDNLEIIRDLVKNLDNKSELYLKSETVRIKYGDATKIAKLISDIVNEQRKRAERENKMAFDRQQAQMNAQGNLASALAQAASGSRTNQQISNSYSEFISSQQLPSDDLQNSPVAQFSSNLTLSPDERSNSIIMYGTDSDLSQVKSMISNLDVLLDQVRIEVIIAQVTLDNKQHSGLESLGLNFQSKTKPGNNFEPNVSDKKVKASEIGFQGTMAGKAGEITGTLKNFAFDTIFNKAKTNSNIKILSTPTIVTTHNRKASIQMGEDRPFAESSVSDDTTGSRTKTNITYRHVGIDLVVTPLIGNNGIIQLEIDQKVSKAGTEVNVGGTSSAVISDKHVTSFVSVADQDVIVMAGFQEKTSSHSNGKLFLLGDLPLVGGTLFSPRGREEETTELIIFIKPTIILHSQDEKEYLNNRLESAKLKDEIDSLTKKGKFLPTKPFPKDTIIGLAADDESEFPRKKQKNEKKASQTEETQTQETKDDSAESEISSQKQEEVQDTTPSTEDNKNSTITKSPWKNRRLHRK